MSKLSDMGLIEATDRTVKSTRPECHRRPIPFGECCKCSESIAQLAKALSIAHGDGGGEEGIL